jgi:hypothetical protein
MALLLCSFTAAAADVSGKWFAQVPQGHGLLEINFTFKVEGAKLTGTATYPLGDNVFRLEITDGKVNGDELSFTITSKYRDTDVKSVYKGKVAGDQINFTTVTQGGPVGDTPQEYDVTAKRVGS